MEYTVRIKSPIFQYGIAFIFCAIIFPFLPIDKMTSELVFMIVMSLIAAIGVWIGAKLTKGKARIVLSENDFEIKWIKRAAFSTLEDTILSFNQLNGWKYTKEPSYHYFILYNTIGKDLIFYRDSIWNPDKDDFGKFLKDFRGKIRKNNNQERATTEVNTEKANTPKLIIDKEASFHNSAMGRLVFYVYIATLIFGIYSLITKWEELDYRRVFVTGLIAGCVGLIIDHLNKIKKNSS